MVDKFSLSRTTGTTENKRKIQVLKYYSETRPNSNELSTTGAHEVGHTLGMFDGGEGYILIMLNRPTFWGHIKDDDRNPILIFTST